jgi:hypothetical protein
MVLSPVLSFFSVKEQERELELSIKRQRNRLARNGIALALSNWLERNTILNLETENSDLRLKIETDEQNLSHLYRLSFSDAQTGCSIVKKWKSSSESA